MFMVRVAASKLQDGPTATAASPGGPQKVRRADQVAGLGDELALVVPLGANCFLKLIPPVTKSIDRLSKCSRAVVFQHLLEVGS